MQRSRLRPLPRVEDFYAIEGLRIGKGSYGEVFKATANGNTYAVKRFKPLRSGDGVVELASLQNLREIKLLKELAHPNVIKLVDQFLNWDEQSLSIVYEFAELDMSRLIRFGAPASAPEAALPDHLIRSLMHQLLCGLEYLHENWIAHRDIKPHNLLIKARRSLKHKGNVRVQLKIAGEGGQGRLKQQRS